MTALSLANLAAAVEEGPSGEEGTTTMRTAMLLVVALATIISSVGCCGARTAGGGCQNCSHGSGCIRNGWFARNFGPEAHITGAQEGAGAPQSAQVAYPYYTNRGPRDFLMNNPPPLGY